jgi:hypothetical protein
MAVTKGTGTTLLSGVTSTTTSSPVSASGDYATDIYVSLSQNGTAATVGGSFQIQISPDGGTTYYSPASLSGTAPITASTTTYWVISLPPSTTEYKITYTQCTTGTCTCTAQSNDVTGI